jgi:hypothetical protein
MYRSDSYKALVKKKVLESSQGPDAELGQEVAAVASGPARDGGDDISDAFHLCIIHRRWTRPRHTQSDAEL